MLAERLGTIIVNRKAIDDNFTLIITEPALGRKGTTLQRRRRRDQLEGRSRCIQTLGGAVESGAFGSELSSCQLSASWFGS